MFGIKERFSKEARIFTVMENRKTQCLLNILKKNVITNNIENDDEIENESQSTKTRFASYNFLNNGYILKRVNHSVWFGYGDFHTNNVEGLWSQIKRLTSDFSGLTINNLDSIFENESDQKSYLEGWICYALLLRYIEKHKLSKI